MPVKNIAREKELQKEKEIHSSTKSKKGLFAMGPSNKTNARAKPTEKQTSKKHIEFCIVTCFDFLFEKQCLLCTHDTSNERKTNQ